jgi:hypothetical protein
MRIKGIKRAIRNSEKRSENFRDDSGTIASGLTSMMRGAIRDNADPVYSKSPVKVAAIKSADNWQVSGSHHLLKILSMAYANYKQYGCAGLEIKILVSVNQTNIEEGRRLFSEAFHNP